MASNTSNSLGQSVLRGALHGNTSNANHANISNHTPANHANNQQASGSGTVTHSVQHSAAQPPQPYPSMSTSYTEDNRQQRTVPESPDHMSTVMAKLWFDHNVESSLSMLKKEEHDKRMKELRKQLEYIADTNWKYSTLEKSIGQQ